MNDLVSGKLANGKRDRLRESSYAIGRRSFLDILGKTSVMFTPGVALVGLAEARSIDEPIESVHRWGMLINVNQCVRGCNECVSACVKENALIGYNRPKTDARWIRKVTIRDLRFGHISSLPLMCQHCQHPPCVDVCPTGASFQRVDGVVLVDKHICIGCRYCMMACPYKARSFVHDPISNQKSHAPRGKGTVEACTLCVHRVGNGTPNQVPACVDACLSKGNGAMVFGDMEDPSSQISRELKRYASVELRGDMRLEPSVRYRGI
uniref:Prokaryotic molybdopterin-containing oxidoreductase family, iron-sulfur binding subunit n=1 Tax=Candidatus Kentrum sp. LFY TaxID=2126342 RepID=A0A450UFE9_9GAMM|nr:MAG: prokaryotic molybdopterin-containing oxidoreductase family, iron-sulfur binding subunit [Candidatus Kentron sp. LFY]